MQGGTLRILFAGTPLTAVPSLHALLAAGHEVAAVLTRPDARTGRGRALAPSPVALAAEEAGLPTLKPARASDPELADELRRIAPRACAVVAYGALLPQSLLDIPELGWVNLHFSLLPAWRGASPVQAAIRHGDDITGATTFLIERELDSGPVYGTVTEQVGRTDTAGALLARLATSGAALLAGTFDALADGSARAVAQTGVPSYCSKITPDDARVDWSEPALAVDRLIRSVTPTPGAWSESPWGRLHLGPVEIVDQRLPSGELVVGRREVLVGTCSTAVRLGKVRAPGRRSMPAVDWARGVRPGLGVRLGGQ